MSALRVCVGQPSCATAAFDLVFDVEPPARWTIAPLPNLTLLAATKDIIFVRNVLTFMGAKPAGPTPLVIDNEGMWFNVRNAGVSARTRHWELWQQFVREAYSKLTLTVHKTPTENEKADCLTKPLPKVDVIAGFRAARSYMLNM